MTTDRNLWLAMQDPATDSAHAERTTCDCGQDLYQAGLTSCPRCGAHVDCARSH